MKSMPKLHSHNQFITCLIGDPVEHSVSDVMFQYFAKLTGIENYNHLKFKISKNNPENLKIAMRAISVFGIAGVNITLPYKENVVKYLDIVDKTAQLVGAVNTIVNKRGKLIGYNTDGHGAIKAIETKLRPIKGTDKIVIFGAGGAARAIIGSLPQISSLIVLSRASDFNRAEKLRKDFAKHGFKIETKPLTDKNITSEIKKANFVINATPVGMYPKSNDSIINKNHLNSISKSTIRSIGFFDAVFNPFETKFLRLVKQHGAKTCSGIYMMVYQGIKAFELWTGKKVPGESVEKVSRLLQKVINSKYGK
ncbi:MAG: shikimate dehydrogenase [Candidatus Harrisonbacteria bacterium CG10_big_fil_rev_8_21_14_0_10_45_28]|uniref:Shikimate dehydrogenase (NADP(+)) n=1 Tax=Candidatus Harrisonbacteria bacterium CG10_big_fil_rev_8_21_14_0_10_45_28 TaxID=1974586 RepID=A0A2H0UPI5_9BACT|nr:MAG: shikimate dehydrogenase [Candidatus Harrisonbacteria bacterium CG10_big_fil_rev_8_21_14_0_10_45_28]